MQSIYTAGRSNYSMANLYKGAGVINIVSSYLPQNGSSYITDNQGQRTYWNGEILTAPTQVQTSVVLGTVTPDNSFERTQENYVFGVENVGLSIPTEPTIPSLMSARAFAMFEIVETAPETPIITVTTTETDIIVMYDTNSLFSYVVTLIDTKSSSTYILQTSPAIFTNLVDSLYYVTVTATNSIGSTTAQSSIVTLKVPLPASPDRNSMSVTDGVFTYTKIDPNVLFYQLTMTNIQTRAITTQMLAFDGNVYSYSFPSGHYNFSLIAVNNSGSSNSTNF